MVLVFRVKSFPHSNFNFNVIRTMVDAVENDVYTRMKMYQLCRREYIPPAVNGVLRTLIILPGRHPHTPTQDDARPAGVTLVAVPRW